MIKPLSINTGDPRSVTGHIISGAVASGILSGSINYHQVQTGQLTQNQGIRKTIKNTAQGGIATGIAIAATNQLGNAEGGWLKALSTISIGMASIYAIEVLDHALTQQALNKNHSDHNAQPWTEQDNLTKGE
jgi:hypothetical protein